MPNLRILAVVFLLLALSAHGAPPAQQPPDLQQSPERSQPLPVRPCLVNSVNCLSMAPQPFRPCLAVPQSCGDHFSITPVNEPAWAPVALPKAK